MADKATPSFHISVYGPLAQTCSFPLLGSLYRVFSSVTPFALRFCSTAEVSQGLLLNTDSLG